MDKRLANGAWMTVFPRAIIRVLPWYAYDHASIVLDTCGAMDARPKPFRFESCWTREESSKGVVARAWRGSVGGSPSYRLTQRLKATKVAFRRQNKEDFGVVQVQTSKL